MESLKRRLAKIIINKNMPVKKNNSKKDITPDFPVRTFVFVAIAVFVLSGLVLIFLSLLSSRSSMMGSTDWIYSRHKFDQYRAADCGGDPLITVPGCPRVR